MARHPRPTAFALATALLAAGVLAAESAPATASAATGAVASDAGFAAALAHLAEHHARLGIDVPAAPATGASGDDPAAALLAVFARLGTEPSSASVAYAESLRGLPPPQAAAIAHVAHAYLDLDAAARTAVLTDARTPADHAAVLVAQSALLDASRALAALAPLDPEGKAAASGFDPTDPVRVELGCNDDVYLNDHALIIEACGNDAYRNNGGGTFQVDGSLGDCDFTLHVGPLHLGLVASAALIELGGNDRYDPTDPLDPQQGSCGANGGGVLGAGFLFDAAGNDIYTASGIGVNGGGHLGAGFLLDAAGDDLYTAVDQGANGGGYVAGHGALLDLGGDDHYAADPLATRAVNGGGYLAGAGFLLDAGTDEQFVDAEAFACPSGPPREVCLQAPDPLQPFLFDAHGTRIDLA